MLIFKAVELIQLAVNVSVTFGSGPDTLKVIAEERVWFYSIASLNLTVTTLLVETVKLEIAVVKGVEVL